MAAVRDFSSSMDIVAGNPGRYAVRVVWRVTQDRFCAFTGSL